MTFQFTPVSRPDRGRMACILLGILAMYLGGSAPDAAQAQPSPDEHTIQLEELWSVGQDQLLASVRSVEAVGDRVYVADAKTPAVWLFTSDGEYVRHVGARGEGPGEFGRYLGSVAATTDTVYVADWTNRRILVYSPDLELLDQLRSDEPAAYPRLDVGPRGALIGAGVGASPGGSLFQPVNRPGRPRAISLDHVHGDMMYDRFDFAVDRSSGRIAVAYMLKDTVEVIEPSGEHRSWPMIRDYAHDAPPPVATTQAEALQRERPGQDDVIAWRTEFDDQGRIWVQAGTYTKHRKRELYVYRPDGTRVAKVIAPHWLGPFTIHGGVLYASTDEGTRIRAYRIVE